MPNPFNTFTAKATSIAIQNRTGDRQCQPKATAIALPLLPRPVAAPTALE